MALFDLPDDIISLIGKSCAYEDRKACLNTHTKFKSINYGYKYHEFVINTQHESADDIIKKKFVAIYKIKPYIRSLKTEFHQNAKCNIAYLEDILNNHAIDELGIRIDNNPSILRDTCQFIDKIQDTAIKNKVKIEILNTNEVLINELNMILIEFPSVDIDKFYVNPNIHIPSIMNNIRFLSTATSYMYSTMTQTQLSTFWKADQIQIANRMITLRNNSLLIQYVDIYIEFNEITENAYTSEILGLLVDSKKLQTFGIRSIDFHLVILAPRLFDLFCDIAVKTKCSFLFCGECLSNPLIIPFIKAIKKKSKDIKVEIATNSSGLTTELEIYCSYLIVENITCFISNSDDFTSIHSRMSKQEMQNSHPNAYMLWEQYI
jgi:hypothetical protein